MKQLKKYFISFLTLLFLLIPATSVFAYGGLEGAYNSFSYADDLILKANVFFGNTGYDYPLYSYYTNYYKSSVQAGVPNVRAFYVDSHGTTDHQLVTKESNGANGYITSNEMYSWTRGFYKLVVFDTCHNGETDQWFKAFNMNYSDGMNHAYFGWTNLSYDSFSYYSFINTMFNGVNGLVSGSTVSGSVWNARTETGITNYSIYGTYSTTMFN